MKPKKTKKEEDTRITAILEAGNGFTRKMILKEFAPRINIPFMYRLRISDPVISDRLDVSASVAGEFVVYRKTKKFAFYRLGNLSEVRKVEII